VAALKKKNATLEHDVRMILAENSSLKSRAETALEQARRSVAEQVAQMEKERLQVLADKTAAEAIIVQANAARLELQKVKEEAQYAQAEAAAAIAVASNTSSAAAAAAPSSRRASSSIDQSNHQRKHSIGGDASSPRSTSPAPHSVTIIAPTPSPAAAATGAAASPANAPPARTPSPSSHLSPLAAMKAMMGKSGSSHSSSSSPSNATSAAARKKEQQEQGTNLDQALSGSNSSSATPHVQPSSSDRCLCQCMPSCVPFPAHKTCLLAIHDLESRLGVSERAQRAREEELQEKMGADEAQLTKLKQEKKLLKHEVRRLMAASAAAAPPSS
jgi:hypothetical protein